MRLRPPTLEIRGAVFLRLVLLAGVSGGLKPGAILESTVSPLGVELADRGLGGWLPSRLACFGGWGKAPMLTVLRSTFPGGRGPAGDSVGVSVGMVGTLEVELVWPLVAGRWGEETALLLLARAGSSEPSDGREADPTFETRDFATGSEGSGPVGGAMDGRDGRGSAWLVMVWSVRGGAW